MTHKTISKLCEGIGWANAFFVLVTIFIIAIKDPEVAYRLIALTALVGTYVVHVTLGIRRNRQILYGKKR